MITVRFEGEGAQEVLRVAKREAKKRLKDSMAKSAEETILPKVKEDSPSIVREALTIKGAVKGPKVTTKGPRVFDRITGLLNFGGEVKTPLAPIQTEGHQELHIGPGLWRARVGSKRKYKGKGFIEDAVFIAFPRFEESVLAGVMGVFNGLPHEP